MPRHSPHSLLAPLLAVAVATMSSTGHGNPTAGVNVTGERGQSGLDQVRDHLLAHLERDVVTPAAYLGDLLGAAGDKVIHTLDSLRAHAKLPAPDVSALSIEPVANASTSGFGWREDPINKRRKFHSGADIRGKHGTPVMAAGAGTVICAESKTGYGNVVFVDHGNGLVTRYAHLRKIEVKQGAIVTAGQRIGQVGSSGRTTGPHLHFEVRIDGAPVDPVTALLVGRLERESPALGRMAAQVLSPDVQRAKQSDSAVTKTSRPERTNAPLRVKKPLS
ncbi:MAG: M23 family metallopeptidase [Deltaproteobacteria bacterium]|nr:M23 family metallopeptidase [Deltaproteobacteria bacterium]